MPNICSEIIPEGLLVDKPDPQRRKRDWISKKLRSDVMEWMRENCQSHWFISKETKLSFKGAGRWAKSQQTLVVINFTCEFDATAWKLVWL